MALWDVYYTATSLEDAIQLMAEHQEDARVMAGGTDLLVEIRNEVRRPAVLIDVTRIGGLDAITLGEDGLIHLGPMVTHT
ncbi:MAG: molybdopterin dehydrogenase, partial [Chloroflexi bacterium]|nr:molybdopterin dehydrogenase [Chloroflexota bacterium]